MSENSFDNGSMMFAATPQADYMPFFSGNGGNGGLAYDPSYVDYDAYDPNYVDYDTGRGLPETVYANTNQQDDDWYTRNTSGQLGVDNLFRGGSVALGLGSIFSGVQQANNNRKAQNRALAMLDAAKDPNSAFYREELRRMMSDPNGYLSDVSTQNRTNTARDAIMRQNALQGRGEMNADQIRGLQDTASAAHQARIMQLMELQDGDRDIDLARANLASRNTAYNIGSAIPGLQNIFDTGQEYAIAEGHGSDPGLRTSAQYQKKVAEARQRYRNL